MARRRREVECDPRHGEIARESLRADGLAARDEVCVGRGVDVLPTLESNGPSDVVFVATDKTSYAAHGRWTAAQPRPRDPLLDDKVHLFGELLAGTPLAQTLRRFHEDARALFETV